MKYVPRGGFSIYQLVVLIGLAIGLNVSAQSPLPIYADKLESGFQDWSWAARDLNNASPVHGGTKSISVTASFFQAASFYHANFDTATYGDFEFWAHGGAGGQRLRVYAQYGNGTSGPNHDLPGTLPANAWQRITIPLATLGVANRPDVNRLPFSCSTAAHPERFTWTIFSSPLNPHRRWSM
jgi:hypothetical protein